MPRIKRPQINYLLYGPNKIPTKDINMKDFEFIDDIKQVDPQDYPRIFTIVEGGMYNHYMQDPDYYYCLLRKDLFKQQLKEIENGIKANR